MKCQRGAEVAELAHTLRAAPWLLSPWEAKVAKHSAMLAPIAMRYSTAYDDVERRRNT